VMRGGRSFRRILHLMLGIPALLLIWLPGTAGFTQSEPPPARKIVTVGVLADGNFDPDTEQIGPAVHTRIFNAFKQEILALTRNEFDIRFPKNKQIEAEWSAVAIRQGLDRLLADPEVDLVIMVGVFSTQEACTRRDLPKPVFAPFGIDAELQELPMEGDSSGIPNLNFLTVPTNLSEDLAYFQRLIKFRRVHVVHDALTGEFIQNMYDYVRAQADLAGFEAIPAPVTGSAEETLASLPDDTEAVYLTPLLRMSQQDFEKVISGLIERKIPTFSIMGRPDVERGILAATAPTTNIPRMARRVALNVHRTLLGEDPGTLPVRLEQQGKLVINMSTARAIGWYPDWRTGLEAELLNERTLPSSRTLTLTDAVMQAVEANLDLASAKRALAAVTGDVAVARSSLLPYVELNASAVQIDGDRAAASLGSQAERTVNGSVALTQLIFSDGARTNWNVEKLIQQAREHQLEVTRLDITLLAANAFLELLRAQALEEIETSNLGLTESHLTLARRRESLGVTGPAEVYRWESELAAGKSRVLASKARVDASRAICNRIANRPLEEPFLAIEPGVAGAELISGDPRLQQHVSNEYTFRIFREFLVEEGLRNTPELRALDAGIEAQELARRFAWRDYGLPDVVFKAEGSRLLSESGEGAESTTLPPPFPPNLFPESDDTNWSMAISVGVPLYTGGFRPAQVVQATETLTRLKLDRASAAEKIELRIRTALYSTGATYPAIELSQESAEAATKNLELVTQTYAQGVVSIIDLLDAQNAALVAEQVSANAVFDFLLDLMEVERASAYFGFFSTSAERDAWFQRLAERSLSAIQDSE
jgi:outer membrane protein